MSKKTEILERWTHKPYAGIASYTLGHETALVQHVLRAGI